MKIETSLGRKYQRKITLEVGKEYIVEPLNPLKMKHRGRRCLLLLHRSRCFLIRRFTDNNTLGI